MIARTIGTISVAGTASGCMRWLGGTWSSIHAYFLFPFAREPHHPIDFPLRTMVYRKSLLPSCRIVRDGIPDEANANCLPMKGIICKKSTDPVLKRTNEGWLQCCAIIIYPIDAP